MLVVIFVETLSNGLLLFVSNTVAEDPFQGEGQVMQKLLIG